MDFTKIAADFGITAALLLMLVYALYRMGTWLAKNVVKPLADRHMVFIEKIEKVQVEQSATLQEIARTQEKQTDIQRDEIVELKGIRQLTEAMRDDQVKGRINAVEELKKDHKEILRRLPPSREGDPT